VSYYCISLNNASKRVVISFRGSVTKKDFRQDSKAVLGRIDNPVKADHLAEELGVHLGFREYLYNEEKQLAKALFLPNLKSDNAGRTIPKLTFVNKTPQMKHQIILEQVRGLFKDHPD
jgi:hypothetical protein